MALPALYAAQPDAVLITRWLAPLAEMAGFHTIAFEPGTAGLFKAIVALRRRHFRRGILLTPSFSSALMLRLGGVRSRRGTNTDSRSALLTSIVDKKLIVNNHRSSVYSLLTTGDLPGRRPVPKLHVTREQRSRFRALVGTGVPLIGIVPGSNAPSRMWPAERFAEVARELSVDGRVVVFGSASEAERTSLVAGDVAIDLGGKTDLTMLAAGLAECGLVVANDSGALHLAAATGVPTVSIAGAGNMAETAPPLPNMILRDKRLPCLECVKNQCPRKGKGYILPDAYNECLHLIRVKDVVGAARNTITS